MPSRYDRQSIKTKPKMFIKLNTNFRPPLYCFWIVFALISFQVSSENRYGPRTIDLDIVVWNGTIIDEHVLEWEFLRKSVQSIAPDLSLKL